MGHDNITLTSDLDQFIIVFLLPMVVAAMFISAMIVKRRTKIALNALWEFLIIYVFAGILVSALTNNLNNSIQIGQVAINVGIYYLGLIPVLGIALTIIALWAEDRNPLTTPEV